MKLFRIFIFVSLIQFAGIAAGKPQLKDTSASYIKTEKLQPNNQKTGEINEDFWNLDLKTMDGKILKLRNFRGKYLYLNFWGEWCPGCREEMPSIVQAYNKFKERAEFIGLLKPHNLGKAKQFIASRGMIFPQVILKNALKNKFNFDGFPLSILIYPDGKTYLRADEVNQIFFDDNIK